MHGIAAAQGGWGLTGCQGPGPRTKAEKVQAPAEILDRPCPVNSARGSLRSISRLGKNPESSLLSADAVRDTRQKAASGGLPNHHGSATPAMCQSAHRRPQPLRPPVLHTSITAEACVPGFKRFQAALEGIFKPGPRQAPALSERSSIPAMAHEQGCHPGRLAASHDRSASTRHVACGDRPGNSDAHPSRKSCPADYPNYFCACTFKLIPYTAHPT